MYPAKEQNYISSDDELLFSDRTDVGRFIEKLSGFISRNKLLLIPQERLKAGYDEIRKTELDLTEEFFPSEEESFLMYEQYLLSLEDLKGADVSLEKRKRYAKGL